MNNRTSFALLAVLTAVGTLTMSSAYAQYNAENLPPACVGCNIDDDRAAAASLLMKKIPVSVWTDKTDYGHNDIIMVKGQVANVSGFPITVSVVSPLNSLVTIDQLTVADDGSFETTLNTAGALWKYDGTYTIKVNYGSAEKSNSAKVELTGGVASLVTINTPSWAGYRIIDIDFYDSNYGLAASEGGRILRTTDGGNIWDTIPSSLGPNLP